MTLTIPERRAAVTRLTADGHSARAIAKQLGVGETTIRRDIDALNGPVTPPTRATGAPAPRRPRLRPRTRRTPARPPTRATPRPDPTTAPATITITIDAWTWNALRWCARAGHPDPQEAIRWALGEQAARLHAATVARECATPMGN